ncbi:hypothetical protein [Arthrobacter sp. Marseille-P9274]|uniref:hypothetical protein n=1 Tax=Arthrobacter sp. Marseille-P9274 TaxID=2866572 RepID=UPI0021C8F823|nr:hypothetical protein [Arthrobacter sp. Marseille-P9274]
MVEKKPMERSNVQRQLAIFEVARRARGKSLPEIRQMLRDAFARRRLPNPPGTWTEAVASEAASGRPYIVDLPAAVAVEGAVPAAEPGLQETPALRSLRKTEGFTAGSEDRPAGAVQPSRRSGSRVARGDARRAGGSDAGRAGGSEAARADRSLAAVRTVVVAAIALTLAFSAVEVFRAIARSRAAGSPAPVEATRLQTVGLGER